jgi:hypothetical protein
MRTQLLESPGKTVQIAAQEMGAIVENSRLIGHVKEEQASVPDFLGLGSLQLRSKASSTLANSCTASVTSFCPTSLRLRNQHDFLSLNLAVKGLSFFDTSPIGFPIAHDHLERMLGVDLEGVEIKIFFADSWLNNHQQIDVREAVKVAPRPGAEQIHGFYPGAVDPLAQFIG